MTKIADLDTLSRPREKAFMYGFESLSDSELLAIIIRCGFKGISAIEMANNILNQYGGLRELLKSDMYTLMNIKGIKRAKALTISAVVELMKRVSKQSDRNLMKIKSASDVYSLVKDELENINQEVFMVLFLNIKLNILRKEILFIGGEVQSLVDVNLLFKKAITYGAKKIICIHNHPSGDVTPSDEDIKITSRIKATSHLVKIQMLDHIIVGKETYYSFSEKNL